MIHMKHLRDFFASMRPTEVDITLGKAVHDLLILLGTAKLPSVGADREIVYVSIFGASPTTYSPVGDDTDRDFRRLHKWSSLLQQLQGACADYQEDCDDLSNIRLIAHFLADGRTTLEPTRQAYASRTALMQFAIQ